MTLPFASITDFKPDTSPQGALAGILQGIGESQTMRAKALANQIAQIQQSFLPQQYQSALDYQKAQTGAIPSEIALRNAQASSVPSEIALRQAQMGAIPSEVALRQAQASAVPSDIASKNAMAQLNQARTTQIPSEIALSQARTQDLLNKAQYASPLVQNQIKQFGATMNKVQGDATDSINNTIPLYKTLLNDLNNTDLTGPTKGLVSWTSPEGQKLASDLSRAQGQFVQQFHLSRMSQNEFNNLTKAVGNPHLYSSTLRELFNSQLDKANQNIQKMQFYHNYQQRGGFDPQEAELKWGQKIGNIPISMSDIEDTAKATGLSKDVIINDLKSKGMKIEDQA